MDIDYTVGEVELSYKPKFKKLHKVVKMCIRDSQKGYLITAELLKEAITDKVEALNEKTLLDVLNEHNTCLLYTSRCV